MISINLNPSPRELTLFSLLLLTFTVILSGLLYGRGAVFAVVAAVLATGAAAALTGLLVPTFARIVYVAMSYAAFPVGWVVSHLVLCATYYLVVTPIGVLLRVFGKDLLDTRFDSAATTYWVERQPSRGIKRYFRQF